MNETGNDGGIVTVALPELRTLGDLIEVYQTDKVSSFHKLRYHVRENQKGNLRRLAKSHGHIELATVKHRTIAEWHLEWTKDGNLAQAHRFIATIRTMCGFGASMLENEQCERICMVLHRMKFEHPIPSTVFYDLRPSEHGPGRVPGRTLAGRQSPSPRRYNLS
jgi:hypothetical protein